MGQSKKLVNNTLIIGVGTLLSRLISIVLVTLYTHLLTTEEYATVDLVIQTANLFLPIVGFGMSDAVFRFLMDKDKNVGKIISNAVMVVTISISICLMFMPLLVKVLYVENYWIYFIVILFVQVINQITKQAIKAKGFLKLYAFGGVLNTFLLVIFNVVWLYVFNLGPVGYFLSIIFSYFVEFLISFIFSKLYKEFHFKDIDFGLLKKMLIYGLPLVPNTIMWWLVSISDRYIINYVMGLSFAGIYAVAHKIPTIINTVMDVFAQAWQISAIESNSNKTENNSEFQSKVLNNLLTIMFFGIISLCVFLKPVYSVFVAQDYFEGWIVIPILLLSVVFQTFQMYLGTNYIVHKKNWKALMSSFMGAAVNILLCFVLTPIIGILGAAISTMVSYLVICVVRFIDTKKYVTLRLDWKFISLSLITFSVIVMILYNSEKLFNFYNFIIFVVYVLLVGKRVLPLILSITRKK